VRTNVSRRDAALLFLSAGCDIRFNCLDCEMFCRHLRKGATLCEPVELVSYPNSIEQGLLRDPRLGTRLLWRPSVVASTPKVSAVRQCLAVESIQILHRGLGRRRSCDKESTTVRKRQQGLPRGLSPFLRAMEILTKHILDVTNCGILWGDQACVRA
jgi:hypothetical protein